MSYCEDPAYIGKAFVIQQKTHREEIKTTIVKTNSIEIAKNEAIRLAKEELNSEIVIYEINIEKTWTVRHQIDLTEKYTE